MDDLMLEQRAEQIVRNRVCSMCREEKPISEFYRDRTQFAGHKHACKVCASKRNQTEDRRLLNRRRAKKRLQFHPQAYRAKQLVKEAIKYGRLKKPQRCACCRSGERQ